VILEVIVEVDRPVVEDESEFTVGLNPSDLVVNINPQLRAFQHHFDEKLELF
jgi:hypothetical protein